MMALIHNLATNEAFAIENEAGAHLGWRARIFERPIALWQRFGITIQIVAFTNRWPVSCPTGVNDLTE